VEYQFGALETDFFSSLLSAADMPTNYAHLRLCMHNSQLLLLCIRPPDIISVHKGDVFSLGALDAQVPRCTYTAMLVPIVEVAHMSRPLGRVPLGDLRTGLG
jgi:hypothetical protein